MDSSDVSEAFVAMEEELLKGGIKEGVVGVGAELSEMRILGVAGLRLSTMGLGPIYIILVNRALREQLAQ